MLINLNKAQEQFEEIVDSLTSGKIKSITITRDNVPVVEMTAIKAQSKRIGAAKEELKDYHLSQEEFDSIKIEGFEPYL